MNTKVKTWLGTVVIIIIAVTTGVFVWQYEKTQPEIAPAQTVKIQPKPILKACPMIAKVCSDGTTVGPTGPNCEFAACPENIDCAKEGESIGAVYPGVVPKKCCDGLVPIIPKNIVGTQGICTKTDISNWQTYRNNEIGIEFKYPAKLATIKVDKSDDGKAIFVNADFTRETANETITTPFAFSASTKDYISTVPGGPFEENKDFNAVAECSHPLVYDKEGNVCKIIDIAGEKAVWQNSFQVYSEGVPLMGTGILFNNKTSSNFKNLMFSLSYPEIENKVASFFESSSLEDAVKKASPVALEYSKNIIGRKNLPSTISENLKLVDQILSTFKFIAPK